MTEWKLLSRHEFPLRWVDIDLYNHLNNAKYYDFMTESRALAFLDHMNDCHFVVVENSCKFKRPIQYPATLIVEQYIQNIRSTSFECVYLIKSGAQEDLHAQGYAKIVCIDQMRNRPCKLPEKLKKIINSLS